MRIPREVYAIYSIVKNLHINPDIWDILIIGVCVYDYINHKKEHKKIDERDRKRKYYTAHTHAHVSKSLSMLELDSRFNRT